MRTIKLCRIKWMAYRARSLLSSVRNVECRHLEAARKGWPEEGMICTSIVERNNLNIRTIQRRFTRLALGFSPKCENLRAAVALQRYPLDRHITVVPLAHLASNPGAITPTTRGHRP